jgi:hypothetical protein
VEKVDAEEKDHTSFHQECLEMTARLTIPSERAHLDELFQKYGK